MDDAPDMLRRWSNFLSYSGESPLPICVLVGERRKSLEVGVPSLGLLPAGSPTSSEVSNSKTDLG